MDNINQFLANPSIRVELELTDKAQTRLIVVAIVIIIIALSASIIYKKII